jgi:hypothetical protein
MNKMFVWKTAAIAGFLALLSGPVLAYPFYGPHYYHGPYYGPRFVGGVVVAPPVVYAPPPPVVYAPPPVVYAPPAVYVAPPAIVLPGIGVRIR